MFSSLVTSNLRDRSAPCCVAIDNCLSNIDVGLSQPRVMKAAMDEAYMVLEVVVVVVCGRGCGSELVANLLQLVSKQSVR